MTSIIFGIIAAMLFLVLFVLLLYELDTFYRGLLAEFVEWMAQRPKRPKK